MNVLNSLGNWFGIAGYSEPVVGIGVADTTLTMVAMRPNPLRITAVVRTRVSDAAVVNGDIRLPQRLATELQAGRVQMRLPSGTPAVIALEPHGDQLAIALGADFGPEPEVEVSGNQYDRCTSVVASAGFRPERVDVIPAALARLGLIEHPLHAVVRDAGGWQVAVSGDGLQASLVERLPVPELRLGPGRAKPDPVRRLAHIGIAKQLDPVVDPALDGVAIGAALGALRRRPLVAAVPAAVSSAAAWMVQRVGDYD